MMLSVGSKVSRSKVSWWMHVVAVGTVLATQACAAKSGGTGGASGAFAGSGGVAANGGAGGAAGGGGSGGSGGGGATGGVGGFGAIGGAGGSAGDDCGGITARAEAQLLPTDVIWSIDTSGSMGASFPAIQQALNAFSQRVVAANIDAHIILLAGAGNGGLCVPAPLGSGNCGAAATPGGPAADSREPFFLHLDLPYGSSEGIPTLLDNHNAYRHLLRPNARTQLVLTEDGAPTLTPAAVTAHVEGRMSATLTPAWMPGLVPGSYQWNGIVCSMGLGAGACFLAFLVPQTSLDLVAQTQGLLGNLANAGVMGATDPFADLLDRLAEQVIVGARVSCDYAIPAPPQGETFDRALVNVEFTSGAAQTRVFPRAADNVPCMDALAWKYDNETTPTRVVLCPAACTLAQNDVDAQVDVSFGCATELLIPD